MTFHKRPALTARDLAIVTGLAVIGLVVIGALVAANILWSRLLDGGGSFLSIWVGAREFVLNAGDPYGADVVSRTQLLVYGGSGPQGQNPYRLDVPFFLLPFAFPLALISDASVARGVWISASQVALLGALVLVIGLLEIRARPSLVAILVLLCLSSLYAVGAYVEGAPAVLLTLGYIGILWAMQKGMDELAGTIGVLCLFKWEVGLPFLFLVAWRVSREQRWRVLAGFGMTLVVLLMLAFLLNPGWFMPFFTASVGMLRSPHGVSTMSALVRLSPDHGLEIARAVTVILIAMLVFEWAVGRDADFRRFVWNACLVLAATPLVGFRTGLENLVALLPCVVLVALVSLQRHRAALPLGLTFTLLAFALPWFLSWPGTGLTERAAQDVLFLLLPLLCLTGMYWTRWWFLRPAQTWLDQVRAVDR